LRSSASQVGQSVKSGRVISAEAWLKPRCIALTYCAASLAQGTFEVR